jgi:hypothetical protein
VQSELGDLPVLMPLLVGFPSTDTNWLEIDTVRPEHTAVLHALSSVRALHQALIILALQGSYPDR